MEKSMEVPEKTKIELSCDPVTPLLGTCLKERKITTQGRYQYTHAYCGIIHNTKDVESAYLVIQQMTG